MARSGRKVSAALLEEALHQPVLEAVEGDDGEPAAGLQNLLGRFEPAFELLKLLVEMDPYRLEGAGRRILLLAGMVAGRLANDVGELAGALDRAGGDDRPGDSAGLGLLAVAVDHVRNH